MRTVLIRNEERCLSPYLWIPVALQGLAVTLAEPSIHRVEREAWAMGTRVRIVVEGHTRRAAMSAAEAALQELQRQERLLSTWDPTSELSRVNAGLPGRPEEVSTELAGLLREVADWSERTGRAFDPAVGALIDAWGLRGRGRTPTRLELMDALANAGAQAFEFGTDGPSVRRVVPGAWIDAGGFGKGAALRGMARVLRGHDLTGALVDLGGQLWAWSEDGTPWPVGLAHPAHRNVSVARLALDRVSVATSGTSERWVDVGGERLGHILDPRTGRPVRAWGSVTVVSADPLAADVLATALYVMGPEAGMTWAREHADVGVLFARGNEEGELELSATAAMGRWLEVGGARADR